jgi:hypothetical protein
MTGGAKNEAAFDPPWKRSGKSLDRWFLTRGKRMNLAGTITQQTERV